MFADVIVDIQHEKLDKIFQYRIPERLKDELHPGMEVIIPFGKGNRQIKGYVTSLSETCNYDLSKVKEITDISRNSVAIEARLIALAAWMKEQYGGTMIQALKTVLPIKQKENAKVKKHLRLLLTEEESQEKLAFYQKKNQKARARLLEALKEAPILDYELVTKKLNVTLPVIRALEEQGVLKIESEQVYRNPVKQAKKSQQEIIYTEEQQHVIQGFRQDYLCGTRRTYLLHGVTGSGKTEVYMEMIRTVVDQGKQAIVLIPEIALTYQTVLRFYNRFGDRVSILNSRMSPGERYDQFLRAKNGEIDVMIGPRSALFTPFANLGLIIIDEEHETSYKSETVPRYHARETAIARAAMLDASVVLGSATPSVDSYYRAKRGEYRLLTLTKRVKERPLPACGVVDLRQELREGNRSILSRRLDGLMEQRLRAGEQTMLFINRRGVAGFVSCRACGHVIKCPHCDVSLSQHANGRMVCHYCGYTEPVPVQCPTCGSKYISGFKAGTEKIEMVVRKRFPEARVLRMDMDTTRGKEDYEQILSAFANHEADILIGTQMIVKGHDFPDVTLVGVLAADLSLHVGDYRAAERTFQLLTQAAGRAGRGNKPGEVVIQTYDPEHYSIETAKAQDYDAFYEQEIAYRKIMLYPPVWNMLVILCASKSEEAADAMAAELAAAADAYTGKNTKEKVYLVGPVDAAIAKVNDIYKKIIYLKAESYDTLVKIKNRTEVYARESRYYKNVTVMFDFNPVNGF